jgi:HSP20 family protein
MSNNTRIAAHDPSAMTRAESEEARRRVTLTPAVDIVEDAQSITVWADFPKSRRTGWTSRYTMAV